MRKTTLMIGLAATTLAAAGIWSAEPAHADCYTDKCDQMFQSAMDGSGISGLYESAPGQPGGDRADHVGRNVCAALDAGTLSDQLVAQVEQGNPSLTPAQARFLIESAHRDLCP
jgi:hypothetical protein